MSLPQDQDVWFQQGLRFRCLPGCRRCCGGAPGAVWVSPAEQAALAACLGLPLAEFEAAYVHQLGARWSLRERPNGDCLLLETHGCGAYAARPRQCRSYPFWPEILASASDWANEARRCPGIGEGALHPAVHLLELLAADKKAADAAYT